MLLALIKKELIALTRDMHGLAALFLMPMVFIVLMSLTLKDIYRPPLAELSYAIDMHDTATPAQWLKQLWQRGHGAPQPLGADWQERLRNGSLKYVIVMEPGLSEELESAALSTEARIRLLTEPGIDANLFNALRAELIGASGELKARLALAVPGTAGPAPDASIQAMVHAERFSTAGPRPTSVQQNVPAWWCSACSSWWHRCPACSCRSAARARSAGCRAWAFRAACCWRRRRCHTWA